MASQTLTAIYNDSASAEAAIERRRAIGIPERSLEMHRAADGDILPGSAPSGGLFALGRHPRRRSRRAWDRRRRYGGGGAARAGRSRRQGHRHPRRRGDRGRQGSRQRLIPPRAGWLGPGRMQRRSGPIEGAGSSPDVLKPGRLCLAVLSIPEICAAAARDRNDRFCRDALRGAQPESDVGLPRNGSVCGRSGHDCDRSATRGIFDLLPANRGSRHVEPSRHLLPIAGRRWIDPRITGK